jgi:general secretion pathway protein F
MLVLCVGVLILLLAVVVPQITAIFESQGAAIPLPTRIVIWLSAVTQSYWWLFILLAGISVFAFRKYTETPNGRRQFDSLLLRIPIIGTTNLKIATGRLARNLGTMLASGIELLSALSITRNIMGNVILEDIIDETIDGVREGGSLARELGRSEKFPPLLIHMIAVGEKTGQLEPMLLRAAKSYESEVNALITGITSIVEPMLIIFITFIVGGILASVMLPMLEMSSLAGLG